MYNLWLCKIVKPRITFPRTMVEKTDRNHHLACTQSSCEPWFRLRILRNRKLLRQLIPLRCASWASKLNIQSEATHAWGPTGIDVGTRRCGTWGTCPHFVRGLGVHCDCLIWKRVPRVQYSKDHLGSNDFLGHWKPITRSAMTWRLTEVTRAPHFTVCKHVFFLAVCC